MQRRVAITGLGIVSTFGNTVDAFWDAVLAGQTGGSEVALEGLPVLPGVRVADFDVDTVIGKREARRMDRVGIFAAVAAAHALADAGQHGVAPEHIGTAIGCAHGGAGTVEETQRTLLERGLGRVSPFAIPLGLVNSPVAGTARLHNLKGPSAAPATACPAWRGGAELA